MRRFPTQLALLCLLTPLLGQGREWTDASGHYTLDAEMIAYNDTTVVLEKPNHDLVSVAIKDLSTADQEYLKSEEAARANRKASDDTQTWTLKSGLKVEGKAIDYARREISLKRMRGEIYVNDKRYDNLPGVYREMLPRIVSHMENIEVKDKADLEKWLAKLKGATKSYTLEGILLELPNGDLYGVPFFFFSDADLKVLQPGWELWLAADKDEQKEQQRFMLETSAQARQAQETQQLRQIMQLQLQMQAYDAGVFDLWEVIMFPPNPGAGPPVQVVVPGRNNAQAAANAKQKYPNYRIGPVAKVRRRID